jgi:hypothetical protein
MLTACSDSDNQEQGGGENPGSEVFHPINASTQTLRDVTEKNTYDPSKFGEVIGSWSMLSFSGDIIANLIKGQLKLVAATRLPQMDALFKERVGTAEDGSRLWNIKRCVFTYNSISGETGNDTTLVGSVIFPTNTVGKPHQVDVLTLYHHQAYFENSWLPSHSVTMMAMHALHNSAVIEPDGQGAKRAMNDLVRENLQGDLTGLQMADCVLAALEVMRQEGVTLADNGYSNNWGTSLGTVAATGFAQYMERDATPDLQALFRLRATYIGEGPTMLDQVKGYEDVVPNPPTQKFYDGWNPRLPFYMSCNPYDELINYNELKKYYTKLRTMPDGSVNNNVQWCDFYLPSIIRKITSSKEISEATWGVGNHYLTAVVSLIFASTVKDPADMEKVLISNNAFDEGQNQ